jgi:hypothetical protein
MASNGNSNTNSNGQSDVIFGSTPAVPGTDKISDAVMNELLRRLQGSVGGGVTGAIEYGSNPPQDKSLLWGNTNDGKIYRYSPDTGEWITTEQDASKSFPGISVADGQQIIEKSDGVYFTQQYGRVISRVFTPSAITAASIDIAISPEFNNTDYSVIVQPDYRNDGRFWLTEKTALRCSLQYEDPDWTAPGTGEAQKTVTFLLVESVTAQNFKA